MALLNSYQNTFAAYSLRKTYSSYSGPLIRLYRDFDAVEADVFADQNGEVSFDSPISVGKQSSSAVVLGEFVGKSGYRNPDSLLSLSVGRISKIYDQSVNANHFLVSTVSKMPLLFDASGTEEIYKINDAPAYFVSQGMNNTLGEGIQLPDVGVEFSMYLSARSSSATPTAFGFSVHDTSNFIIFPNISFFYNSKIISSSPDYYVLNNVRYNTRQGEVYSATQYELPVVPSDGVYLFSLNVVRPDTNENQLFPETQKVTPWNGHIYSDVIIYEGYDPQRDYAVESFMADEFQAVATKALVEESTESGFLTQFPNAAAAYSVRSLRGLTGLNGPKVLRVRREVDDAEADVYTDSTGWVSLDSPVVIVPAITGQIDGGTGVEIDSLANTLGEFVADADHDDVDSLGSPTTAKVVVWYDQSSADYTIISEEIDARGAPVRIRVVGGTYDAYEFDLYFDDNESISLSSYVADTYEISDGATQVTANLTLGTLQTLVDAGMTEARVCVWYDQSGNANNATQTTTANQWKIYDSSTGVVVNNGIPSLQRASSTTAMSSVDLGTIPQPLHVMSVQAASGSDKRPWRTSSSSMNTVMRSTDLVINFGSVEVTSTISPSPLNGALRLMSVLANATTKSHFDGVEVFSGNAGANGITGLLEIGSTVSPVDWFSEFIVYPSDQSSNRTGIEATINNYYDIYDTGNTGGNIKTLDVFPDAAAAYSLRKLRTSYNGPVNLNKRKDAIQNVATAQPKIYDGTAGVVTENGKPAVDFDGVNDYLDYVGLTETTLTSFHVAKPNQTNTGDALLGWDGATGSAFFRYNSDGTMRANFNGGFNTTTNYTAAQNLVFGLFGTSLAIGYNGATAETGSATGLTSTGIRIGQKGNVDYFNGKAHEIVVYASDQSANRTSIENNINSAFQIYAANFSSVLDSVPLAKAAYSIRRLTKNYIGPIITVTNGSTTKDFYADFWGNLDVDALTSFANGGTLSVTKWWDQSGEGVHLLTTSTRPTLTIANNEVSVNTTNKFYEPLLDRYEGAAAAYSLRILKGDYTGPLVRVRRDGTNTEVDVYPDENLTISLNSPVLNVAETTTDVTASPADTLATTLGEFVADAGALDPDSLGAPVSAFVVVWYDQAGANNLEQTTTSEQPKIYDSVTGVEKDSNNNKPIVRRSELNQALYSDYSYNVGFKRSFAFVGEANTSFTTICLIGAKNSGGEYLLLGQLNSTTTTYVSNASISELYVDGASSSFANRGDVYDAVKNGPALIFANADFTGSNTLAFGYNAALSISGFGMANMQEFVIWGSDIETTSRTGIETNINDYYSIYTGSVPEQQTVAVYNNAINTTVDLNATYTDLKEIIKYE